MAYITLTERLGESEDGKRMSAECRFCEDWGLVLHNGGNTKGMDPIKACDHLAEWGCDYAIFRGHSSELLSSEGEDAA